MNWALPRSAILFVRLTVGGLEDRGHALPRQHGRIRYVQGRVCTACTDLHTVMQEDHECLGSEAALPLSVRAGNVFHVWCIGCP